jgi:von Willebrand factor A domain-containing protein 7
MIRRSGQKGIRNTIGIGGVCACAVAALGQLNPSHSFGPDQCGPVDPAYISTANATGGVPLFLQRSEAGKAMQLMRESTRPNISTVLWASEKLTGAPQNFEIPVDSSMQRITFTFSVDSKKSGLILKRPDGHVIGEGSSRTEDTELNCGRIITVDKPEAGIWQAEVRGESGRYWLVTEGQSDIYFIKAEFVSLGGRPGHEGLFRIQGQPIAGQPAILQESLSATETQTTEFSFVSERGEVLQKLNMKVTDPDREFMEFTGDVMPPAVPFRIAVSGRDAKGMRYQRFDAPLSHAETVQVIPKLDFNEIAAGTSKQAVFEVKNFGPARSFKVMVTDAQRFIVSAAPTELTIPEHGSGIVHVHLTVPGTAKPYSSDDVVVIANSTSGAAATNSAIVRLEVSGAERSVH